MSAHSNNIYPLILSILTITTAQHSLHSINFYLPLSILPQRPISLSHWTRQLIMFPPVSRGGGWPIPLAKFLWTIHCSLEHLQSHLGQVQMHAAPITDKEIGETMETYPLQFTEPHYDADDIDDVKDNDPPSKVSAGWPIWTIHSSMSHRHKWANGLKSEQDISILLLENEGLTREPTCSMCDNPMDVKCSDCLGGNYFFRNCAIQSHQHTPFHRLPHWTGDTLPLSHCIHLVLCCFLGMMVCHAHSL